MSAENRKRDIAVILESIYAIKRRLAPHEFGGNNAHRRSAKKSDLTIAQWAVLALVMKSEGLGIKELSGRLGITSSAATQIVSELERKGYLVREASDRDRRALTLKLTARRRQQLLEMRAAHLERFAAAFKVLTDKEIAQYASLSRKIART